ncbi:type II toxin-antitoxin system HicB family antitoxin [Candidatus Poriferisodalis sp.]|uniref:type II toxin-antitoxin system HicB family antitoxin n=1 Tax=Candidatus Poriferisodalis sp. TaxID=3101277 RepID=UPI003B5A7702
MFNANGQLGDVGVRTTKIVYWQEDEWWLGYLEEFPDYWTQGKTLDDLEEHLRYLHADLTSGELSGMRRVADLTLA